MNKGGLNDLSLSIILEPFAFRRVSYVQFEFLHITGMGTFVQGFLILTNDMAGKMEWKRQIQTQKYCSKIRHMFGTDEQNKAVSVCKLIKQYLRLVRRLLCNRIEKTYSLHRSSPSNKRVNQLSRQLYYSTKR